MCHVNYAAGVRIIAPQRSSQLLSLSAIDAAFSVICCSFHLYTANGCSLCVIFSLTPVQQYLGGQDAKALIDRFQTDDTTGTRLAQSAPTSGDRPTVPRQRLLRPTRPRSGQIRNAPPSESRGTIGASSLSRLRFLPPRVSIGAQSGSGSGGRELRSRT